MVRGYETLSDQDGKDIIIFVEPSESTRPSPSSTQASSSRGSISEEGYDDHDKEENRRSAAFDPETGEINWDCPCLGGMAQPPCGEAFKAAFSCFVFSEAEPKGIDCVDKFQAMQECFKLHPDIYGDELDDEEEEEAKGEGMTEGKGSVGRASESKEKETPSGGK
ncbi:mitochondrial intermembrane space import and assembly protein 40 [Entomortierella parvispora]|uniref:Mitochondrial intermembrane space import and assembly protein 40 n=1 Tax=Entomortierella parvispora TaxID=205924 RepID=A0A9P3LWN0_9FUNG|nr:mitochondrial intermembrane space import and assembly protein 40 [Entomortierella parvispora]